MPGKIVVRCDGCAKTQTLRPSRLERCDGYYCITEHEPKDQPAPGLVRELVINAAGGFWGWRDIVPDDDTIAAIDRARQILVLGIAQDIIDRAGRGAA